MSVLGSNILAGASGAGGGYDIDNSVRFYDGDSSKLSRTPGSASNRKTWTISCWIKLSARGGIIPQGCFLDAGSNPNYIEVGIGAGGEIRLYDPSAAGGANSIYIATTRLLRDPSAWYHIVIQLDTTESTDTDRVKIYVNNERVTDFSQTDWPSLNYDSFINNNIEHTINVAGSSYSDCYMAEYHFIDGTALTPSSFGELNATTNQWVPIEVTGLTYGTNGFYQKYDDPIVRKSFTTAETTTWTAPDGVTSVDYLVVGGGGAGGTGYGPSGGGGAGGYRTATSYTVVPGNDYTITVGAGGVGADGGSVSGAGPDGADSVFSSITSAGGGGGGGNATDEYAGNDGGSGGGGYFADNSQVFGGSGNTPSTSPAQGYDGGLGGKSTVSSWAAGGGGGASAVGGNAQISPSSSNDGGAGGAGTANSITGSSVTYAGGGGGAIDESGSPGAGGSGGGGAGCHKNSSAAVSGTVNTGGGGGGAGWNSGGDANEVAGSGGSGIVVLKYGTGFGKDSSGEDNTFTGTNLVATDQMPDTPTNNFATLNPLINSSGSPAYSEGNLVITPDGSNYSVYQSTISVSSGKWYAEYLVGDTNTFSGVSSADQSASTYGSYWDNTSADFIFFNNNNGNKIIDGAATSYVGSGATVGQIVGVAIDVDSSAINFYINNSSQGSISFSGGVASASSFVFSGVGYAADPERWNFGQDSSFAGTKTAQGNQDGNDKGDFYYEPPTDYLALCTDNLSDPEIKLPGDNFNTVLYTGDGSTQAITGVGFQPDFVWLKNRNSTGSNMDYDSVRGATYYLHQNETNGQTNGSDLTSNLQSFDSDGFTVIYRASNADNTNRDTYTYASWNWKAGGAPTADNSAGAGAVPTAGSVKIDGVNFGSALAGTIAAVRLSANTKAGFSVVEFEGSDSTQTVAHGLSQTPELLLGVKGMGGTSNWPVYHKGLNGGTDPEDYYLYLNLDAADGDSAAFWNDTPPTSSVFTISTGMEAADTPFVAYCFHSIEGYSKVGSYIGNGNTDGAFIYTSFKPAFILGKNRTEAGYGWWMVDTTRSPYNNVQKILSPQYSSAETDVSYEVVDIVSNGFKFRIPGDDGNLDTYNGTDDGYIYIALAESPFKYSNAR